MRKFTLLLAFMAGAFSGFGQNLLNNGGFESWKDTVPDNWTLTKATGQKFAPSNKSKTGLMSLLSEHKGTSGTAKIVFSTKVVVDSLKDYVYSFWYYVDSTSTNAKAMRYWGYWNNPDGSSNSNLNSKDLQNGDAASYLPTDNKGVWIQKIIELNPPTGAGTVQLELRFYNSAKIYVDDVWFGTKSTAGFSSTKQQIKFYTTNKTLCTENIPAGTKVEVYNALGKKVNQGLISTSTYDLSKLTKGIYIVKVGNLSKKVIL